YLTDTAPSEYPLAPTDVWLEVRGSRGAFHIDRLDAAEFLFRNAVLERQPIGTAAERALDADARFDVGRAFTTLVRGGAVDAATSTGPGGHACAPPAMRPNMPRLRAFGSTVRAYGSHDSRSASFSSQ